MKITVITHYGNDDEECSGDYIAASVELDGERIAEWGDYYHDKGEERAEEFADGIKYGVNLMDKKARVTIKTDRRNDGDDFM